MVYKLTRLCEKLALLRKSIRIIEENRGNKEKNRSIAVFVPTTGVEPARPFEHYPLKVACLPIPPRGLFLSQKIGF